MERHLNPQRQYFVQRSLPWSRPGDATSIYPVEEWLYRGRTAWQEVEIFRSAAFGTVLALDGIIQLSESDETIYHEMLVHPALLSHPGPRRILIIGGGDGGTARECLKHDPEELVLVEIDPEVIELSRRYLPFTAGPAFNDGRLTVVCGDGAEVVRRYEGRFDAVLVDSADEAGPAAVLFQEGFYRDLDRALAPGGVATFQVGSLLELEACHRVAARLRSVFAYCTPLRLTLPVQKDGDYCFIAASRDIDVRSVPADLLAARLKRVRGGDALRYYTPAVHRASQVLPPLYAAVTAGP
ncbi:MAG: polyamine aminopropyltransferase [Gemmatimonadota bacterium]